MTDYNPREIRDNPKIGVPTIGIGRIPLPNAFGEIDRKAYEIVETDESNLLWENGSAMSWEDGDNVLLEHQKQRIWLKARK